MISNVPESRSTFSIYKSADQISENMIKVNMKFIVFENNFLNKRMILIYSPELFFKNFRGEI